MNACNSAKANGSSSGASLRFGIALRNEGEDGGRFGQHAALGNQRRHATFRIDREILGLRLLGASEVDSSRFEGGAGLFERDMRRQCAGVGRIIESEHDSSSLVVAHGRRRNTSATIRLREW